MKYDETKSFQGNYAYVSKNDNVLILEIDAEAYCVYPSISYDADNDHDGESDFEKFEVVSATLNGVDIPKKWIDRILITTKMWEDITELVWSEGV